MMIIIIIIINIIYWYCLNIHTLNKQGNCKHTRIRTHPPPPHTHTHKHTHTNRPTEKKTHHTFTPTKSNFITGFN